MRFTSPAGVRAGSSRSRRSRGRNALAALPDPVREAKAATAADRRAREKLASAAAAGKPMLMPSGIQRSPITLPEYRRGRAPANKGRRFPPEVLTAEEIQALLDAFPGGPCGVRSRAMVVLLWRSGLRIGEARALRVDDVNVELGALVVMRGKGAKHRVVGIDASALEYLREWLELRESLGAPADAPLFCTVREGRFGPLPDSGFREQLKRTARQAGIRKRVSPHGLRHTHASDLAIEGVPIHVISAQLGHSSIAMTAHYIDHLAPRQVFRAIAAREWPDGMVPAPVTRAAGSQGAPAPRRDTRLIPAYTPEPREPEPDPVKRTNGTRRGSAGAAKAKILEVLQANGGRATQSQLARALKIRERGAQAHCRDLAAVGKIVRVGELAHPAKGKARSVIWALPALKAVFELDPMMAAGRHARPGQGPERVLAAVTRLGGRASQAQLAGELGLTPETIGIHCRTLEGQGRLERGGLDKTTNNRGSQTWKLPGRERITTKPGPRLRIAAGSTVTGSLATA